MKAAYMVYSSRSGPRSARRRLLEVTAAQLFCDAHRIRCDAAGHGNG
jgi:hypothetical protein